MPRTEQSLSCSEKGETFAVALSETLTKYLTRTLCAYLPVHGDGEDGLHVGQHCFELLRILFESHFCQYQRLANVLDREEKHSITGRLLVHHQKHKIPVCDAQQLINSQHHRLSL